MPNTNKIFLSYTPAIGWGILITYFSLLPGPQVPPLLKSMEDFFLHYAIYFMFTALICLGRLRFSKGMLSTSYLSKVVAFGILFGAVIELVQEFFILNRIAGWDDFAANSLGAFCGVLLVKIWTKV